MKTVTGKVLSVNLNMQVPKFGGGTYPGWQLIYMDSTGKAQTLAKHIKGLEYAPALKEALEALAVGDDITIELEKQADSKFWDVASITKGIQLPVSTSAPTKEWKSDKSGNTYETAEERTLRRTADVLRQRLIVRQSSFDQARQLLGADTTFAKVSKLSKQIEDFIYEGVYLPGDVSSNVPAEVA